MPPRLVRSSRGGIISVSESGSALSISVILSIGTVSVLPISVILY